MNGRSGAPEGSARKESAPFRARRRDAAVQALMEAAELVIAEKGYEGATMQDIAVRAGCAAGTTYLYFPGKEDLFHAIVTRHVGSVSARVQEALRAPSPAIERLKGGLSAVVGYFNEHRDFFRIFYSALPGGRAHIASNLRGGALDAFSESRRRQIEVVREAQRDGAIRRDLSADDLVDFMHGVNVVTFARWSLAEEAPPASEQLDLLWELEVGGLRGQQGGR